MNYDNVSLEVNNGVAWLTLANPKRYNAMSMELLQDFRDAVLAVRADAQVRCLVITGQGPAFSAGGDLSGFRQDIDNGDYESFLGRLRFGQQVFNTVEDLKLPVIAAVNGYAIAGGLELLLCCDLVFAAESAMIGDGHIKYGVIPGGGSSVRLARKLSMNQANRLLLTGELFPAAELKAWGLVNEVYQDDRLISEVERVASLISKKSPFGIGLIKKLAVENRERDQASGLEAELSAFATYARHPDFQEGLRAFAEKRLPEY